MKILLMALAAITLLNLKVFSQDSIKTFTLEGAYLYSSPDYSARTDSEFFVGTDIYISKYEEGFYKITGGYIRASKVFINDKLEAYNKSLHITVNSRHSKDIYSGSVEIGMTESQVRKILGPPNEIHNITSAGEKFEQWIYDNKYLYFENGKLFSIQQ